MFYDVCSLTIDFQGSADEVRPPPVLREDTNIAPGTDLGKAINRFRHLHIGLTGAIYSCFTVHARIRLPKAPVQTDAVVNIGCPIAPKLSGAPRKRALMAARRGRKGLGALVQAVVERERDVAWRSQDFEDVARVMKAYLLDF